MQALANSRSAFLSWNAWAILCRDSHRVPLFRGAERYGQRRRHGQACADVGERVGDVPLGSQVLATIDTDLSPGGKSWLDQPLNRYSEGAGCEAG